jgi:hypothetical protein
MRREDWTRYEGTGRTAVGQWVDELGSYAAAARAAGLGSDGRTAVRRYVRGEQGFAPARAKLIADASGVPRVAVVIPDEPVARLLELGVSFPGDVDAIV